MKFARLATAALLLAGTGTVAHAQGETSTPNTPAAPAAVPAAVPTEPAVGLTVYDTNGDTVGTINQYDGQTVVLDTGDNMASFAKTAIGANAKGLFIELSKSQIDRAVDAAEQEAGQKLAALLVPGATVLSSDNVEVGTVKEIDAAGNVVIEREAGPIALPKNQFVAGATGGLSLAFTAAQLEAAIGGTPAAPGA